MSWSKGWINYLDIETIADQKGLSDKIIKLSGGIDLCPLQFANCDRLERNDAVYIFDEVGSGKTINSGLMALHYLYNHKDKNVLVITVPSLVKPGFDNSEGQFKNKWLTPLPFKKLGLEHRFTVINNVYSNIEKKMKNDWGLVIIDEAHVFLSKDTKRYVNLVGKDKNGEEVEGKGIKADKVVFLTATPVKDSRENLETYVDIAEAITGKDQPSNWIQEICKAESEGKPICSKFDPYYPASRYFKDTVKAFIDGEKGPPRLFADTWECDGGDKKFDTLLEHIDQLYREDDKNRFLIFVRFVYQEAKKLENYLIGKGFKRFGEENTNGEKTVKAVTGVTSQELSKFKSIDPKDLPTVLILTYQISEQGVDMPGFNHVVNYHIPASPASLEQRYGRIDRLTSERDAVHIHYLILRRAFDYDNCRWDSATFNYHDAIGSCIRDLLTCLPSKNVLLTEELLDKYVRLENETKERAEYIKAVESAARSNEAVGDLLDILKNRNSDDCSSGSEEEEKLLEEKPDVKLLEILVSEEELEITSETTAEDLGGMIRTLIKTRKKQKKISEKQIQRAKNIVKDTNADSEDGETNEIGNRIFFMKKEVSEEMKATEAAKEEDYFYIVDAVGDKEEPKSGCAAAIYNSDKYKKYNGEYERLLQSAMEFAPHRKKQEETEAIWNRAFADYKGKLEEAYEQLFMDNRMEDIFCFENIFGQGGYRHGELEEYWKKCFNENTAEEICGKIAEPEDKHALLDYLREKYMELPFFQMCKKFQELLIENGNRNRKKWEESEKLFIKRRFESGITPVNFKKRKIETVFWNDNPLQIPLRDLAYFIKGEQESIKGKVPRYQQKLIHQKWALRLSEGFVHEMVSTVVEDSEKTCRIGKKTYRIKEGIYQIKMEKQVPISSNWLRLVYVLTGSVSAKTYKGADTTLFKGFLFKAEGPKRDTGLKNPEKPIFRSLDTDDGEWKQTLEKWRPEFERGGGLIKCDHDLDMSILDLDMADGLDYSTDNLRN